MALYRCGGGGKGTLLSDAVGGGGASFSGTTTALDLSGKKAVSYVINYYFNAVSGGTKTYSWKFQGSNNGSTWTDIDTGTQTTPANTTKAGTISNDINTSYTYYRGTYTMSGPGSVQSTLGLVILAQ